MRPIQSSLSVLFLFLFVQCSFHSHAQAFNYKWGKQVGGKNAQGGNVVCVGHTGDVTVGGNWQDEIDFNPPNNTDSVDGKGYLDNIFVVQYDFTGNQKWRFVLKSQGPYGISITDIETDAQGNITIGGNYASNFDLDPDPNKTVMTTMSGSGNSFIAKYDSNGKYLWSVLLKASGPFSTSVKDLEVASHIGAQGDVYVTGNFQQKVDFDPDSSVAQNLYGGSNSIYIARYSNTGQFVDVHFFYCDDANYSYPTDLAVDKGGNVFVTGNMISNTFAVNGFLYPGGPQLVSKGYGDIFLVKLNKNLDPAWSYAMNTTDREVPTALAIDDSSNVFITGDYTLPIDMDPSASTWTLKYNYINQTRQVFVAKYDSSGTIKWAKSFDGKGSIGACIDLDSKRNIYLTLGAADTVWLNPGVDNVFVYTPGGGQGFVAMDANGKGLFGNIYGGQNMIQTQACMDVDRSSLVFTNNFFGQLDLDFSSGTAIKNSVDYSDGFTALYAICNKAGTTPKPTILTTADSICAGDSLHLRVADKGYDVVAWSTSVVDTFIVIYSPGVYKVSAISGCSAPARDSIVIRQGNCNNSGIQGITANNALHVYPNPASGQVRLRTDAQEAIQSVVILDMKGSVVLTKFVQNTASDLVLDILCLQSGAYVVQVITDGNVYHQRLVVEM